MLSGGVGLDMATIGSFARAMAPAGGAAPLAGQIEYRWPASPAIERDNAPDDEVLLPCSARVACEITPKTWP